MATRVIDDSKLQNIAVAIQSKDNGGQMTVEEMPGRIEAIPSGSPVVLNPALILWDWEGTKLAEYSREDALALTELPAPSALPMYAAVDHELLLFQEWNWSLTNIKTWIQNHEGDTLNVGAIYTTTDGQNHNYWGSPRLDGNQSLINMCKRGTIDDIGYSEFNSRTSLEKISIPYGALSIGAYAFNQCTSLIIITIPNGITNIGNSAFSNCQSLVKAIIPPSLLSMEPSIFNNCLSLRKICIPDSVTSIGNNAFNNCQSLVNIEISNNIMSFESTVFQGCLSLPKIHIPGNVISIGNNAFNNCKCLCDILNECKAALANINAFNDLPSNYRIYVPRADLSWFETATNWATIYTQGHIVAIEDYIEYLESIGFNVDKYKEAA